MSDLYEPTWPAAHPAMWPERRGPPTRIGSSLPVGLPRVAGGLYIVTCTRSHRVGRIVPCRQRVSKARCLASAFFWSPCAAAGPALEACAARRQLASTSMTTTKQSVAMTFATHWLTVPLKKRTSTGASPACATTSVTWTHWSTAMQSVLQCPRMCLVLGCISPCSASTHRNSQVSR